MIVCFKCYLADGSERTHSYDFGNIDKNQFKDTVDRLINGIEARLEAGRSLPLPHPNTIYAPGQVKYVEMVATEELEESTREEFRKKMGFVKE